MFACDHHTRVVASMGYLKRTPLCLLRIRPILCPNHVNCRPEVLQAAIYNDQGISCFKWWVARGYIPTTFWSLLHTHTHTHVHTHKHAHTHIATHRSMHTCRNMQSHTHRYTSIHMHTTYTQTCARTHQGCSN